MLADKFDWAVLLSVKMAMQTINRVHDIVTEWFFSGGGVHCHVVVGGWWMMTKTKIFKDGRYSEVGCTPTTMFDAVQTKQYFILRNLLESS
jgi:hypothetical protein